MGFKFKELKRWDPVRGLVKVFLCSSKGILIIVSLVIVLWQGYDVTQTYLSKPTTTKFQILPLTSMPDIHLSICNRFEILDCSLSQSNKTCLGQNLPPYVEKGIYNEDIWKIAEISNVNVKVSSALSFKNILDQVQFWNDFGNRWETVFDSSRATIKEEKALFTTKMYPFTDNYTLLCHTLNQDIRTLAPIIKLMRRGDINIV
jgi:hypothetical protein